MLNISSLSRTNKFILAAFAFLAVMAFGSGRAHAATLTVSGGCTLDEAITSVNNGSAEPGCTVGGYGTNDTINIPAGTQTLTANLPAITEDVVVNGAGINSTTIDGNAGQYRGFSAGPGIDVVISNIKIIGFKEYAITTGASDSVAIRNVEIDGSAGLPGGGEFKGIFILNGSPDTATAEIQNVYIHDLSGDAGMVAGLAMSQYDGGTTNATLQNVTIASIENTKSSGGSGAIGVILAVGVFGDGFGGFGTLNTTASNITIDDIHNVNSTAAAFSNNAYSADGDANVITTINNVTITNTDGQTEDSINVPSAAFYAVGIGIETGTTATSTISVGNSLMASNSSDGASSNCITGDLTSLISGTGSTQVSVNSLGHNIFDDGSCANVFTAPTDQHNLNNIMSTLGPLKNNGGAVPTRALLAGSPAISAGGAVLGVTTDARGVARTGHYSVGAYQYVLGDEASNPTTANNAGAPNTGIRNISVVLPVIASLFGLTAITYAFRRKATVK